MIIVITTAITYTTFSMNEITQLAETIQIKQVNEVEKISEEFEIVNIRTDNNQFNMTIKNNGDIPVHLTRLWVENTTDSTWPMSKYDLDVAIPTGGIVKNIGQNIGLTSIDTQSYKMNLVTERGNVQKMFLNGVGDQTSSLYLNLRATPTVVPTGFTTTVLLEVINTGTSKLLNLQPTMAPVQTTCLLLCSAVLVSGPTPTSFDSLDPGNIAIFEWVYTISGDDNGDSVIFTASLVNGVNEVETTVSTLAVKQAENAEVSLESGGVVSDALLDDDILLFHMEQDGVPSPGYQMMSSSVDGGTNGRKFDMETQTDGNPVSFMTNNGTIAITVPAGIWTASLPLRSEPVATSIKDKTEHMIFHFEDGDGVPPDNSEGTSSRNLENCGLSIFQERIQQSEDDAEQDAGGSNDVYGSSSDFELVYDGNYQWIGMRWSLDIPQGAQINSADIRFSSDETQTGSSPSLIIGAEDTDNAAAFANISHNIDDRWDGTTNTVTSATVTWSGINGWSDGEEGADTTTPDLSNIVQEIVNRPGWASGQNIVFIIKDNSGGSNNNKRTAEHYDSVSSLAPRLTVNYGTTGTPDWQAGSGPHGSGAYYYDGTSMCHRSQNGVTTGNDLVNNDYTTSLWFRTDGVDQVTSEQMLVFWEGEGSYPTSDYSKISIGSDVTNRGKILFAFDVEKNTQTTSCLSANEYDDGNWHHIEAVRTEVGGQNEERCDLYITDINGVDEETVVWQQNDHSSSYLNQDSPADKWYVASREENGNYFKGWIDDVMHWNTDALDTTELEDLSLTNYGDTSHQFIVALNMTDTSGNFITGLYTNDVLIPFQDPKGGADTTDSAYSMYNVTMNIPEVVVLPGYRINYTMSFIPSTSIWEALELDMKIDDIGFVDPYSAFLQMPMPDRPFPSYVVYDKTTEMELFVNNVGNDGIYFIYSGTRLSFYSSTLGSYAALIHFVNGTSSQWAVDINKDSIYIPTGESAQLIFYNNPTDHPCQGAGQTCQNANIMPNGVYSMAAWVNGYSDQGETFGRTVQLGSVTVQD